MTRAVVRGSGVTVTSVGRVSSCPYSGQVLGWNISPNPSGDDTTYKVSAGGIDGGRVELSDGREKANDVYTLDSNQFAMHDGFGNDVYNLVADLSLDTGQQVLYDIQKAMTRWYLHKGDV